MTGEASPPGGRLIRVFLTDDVDELRLLLRLGLEDAGDMTVVGEAGDGADAVAQAGEIQPDVMLLDLSMPIMDGLEAIPLLRERVPGMKIVVVSGFAEGPASKRAIELGADRYVSKTADIHEVHDIVRQVVQDSD